MAVNDRKRVAAAPPTAGMRGGPASRVSRPRQVQDVPDNSPRSRRQGSATRNASSDRARPRAMSRKLASKPGHYKVIYERDESGAWLARVPSVRGCHTYGRTLDQARRRIREALSLWVDHADRAELVEEVRLPRRVRGAINASRARRLEVEQRRAEAHAATVRAARALVDDCHVGLRDAAELLGLSHQRVQQLLRQ